jgi:enoyl-CoA hydratase/carnithine racemase
MLLRPGEEEDVAEELLENRDGPVAILTLNRPEVRNALSVSLRYALGESLAALAADPSVRAVVLAGEGTVFCSGMDRSEFGSDPEALFDSTEAAFGAFRGYPKPTIAAVHGPALGGGFYLALAADLRVGCPATAFGTPEVTFGVPPSWGWLRPFLGEARAREVALTGRSVGAEEAFRIGLLASLAKEPEEVLPAAVELAVRIASHPERGVGLLKELMAKDQERTIWPAMEDEMAAFRAALGLDR